MKTTIDYCTGIHEATGLPMCELRDIITELPDDYRECPQEDQERVAAALHRVEVARTEAQSRMNRGPFANPSPIALWEEEWLDRLFDAAREDADTFVSEYTQAAEAAEAICA